MSLRDELAITGDDALGLDAFGGRRQRAGKGDVINPETHDHILGTRLSKHVAFEACQARLPEDFPIKSGSNPT